MQTLSWWYLHRWAAQSVLSAFESLYMKKEEEISSVSVCETLSWWYLHRWADQSV